MLDCLNLLHCHVGSQLYDIRVLKNAINELTHIYCELVRLGAGLTMLDIGGGMGVDYDGSQSAWSSSINYTVAEYAADVVYRIKSVCDDAKVPHPHDPVASPGARWWRTPACWCMDVLGTSRFESKPGCRGASRRADQGRERAAPAGARPARRLQQHHRPELPRGLPRRDAGPR